MNWRIFVPLVAVVFTASAGLTGAAGLTGGARLLGGLEDADMTDKSTQNALQFAVVQHNRNSNDVYVSQLDRVIKVQQQIVAGIKYIFTVEMGKTSCRKGGAEKVCSIHEDPTLALKHQCKFEVWSRPWLNDIKLVKNPCLAPGESY